MPAVRRQRPGPPRPRALLREAIAVARTLEPEGLVVGTVGNVSVRIGEQLRITPSRTAYGSMRVRDLVAVDVASGHVVRGTRGRGGRDRREGEGPGGQDRGGSTRRGGQSRGGPGTPSRELPLHLAVMCARPDVGAVLHTHSVAATAWSFLDEPLRPELEDLAYHGIEPVRTSPPAAAGSAELARVAAATLGDGTAVLLGHHGVLTVGATPREALLAARVVERQARVAWLVRGAAPWATGVASAVLDDVAGSPAG